MPDLHRLRHVLSEGALEAVPHEMSEPSATAKDWTCELRIPRNPIARILLPRNDRVAASIASGAPSGAGPRGSFPGESYR